MATPERRRKLTIEEVNVYWRRLKEGVDRPSLHKVCNAIRILDFALMECDSNLCKRLSADAWSRQRDDYFDILISSFRGYFVVYSDAGADPVEAGSEWPETGTFEFYPEMVKRRDDACRASLSKIHPALMLRLRWCFAEGRQYTTPEDFNSYHECSSVSGNTEEAQEAQALLDALYEACADEASKLKKLAHRKWWQLQSEVTSCADRRHRSVLKKQMEQLELVWGQGS